MSFWSSFKRPPSIVLSCSRFRERIPVCDLFFEFPSWSLTRASTVVTHANWYNWIWFWFIISTVKRFEVSGLVITNRSWSENLKNNRSSTEFVRLSTDLKTSVCILLRIEIWKSVVVGPERMDLYNSKPIKFQNCFRTKQLLYGFSFMVLSVIWRFRWNLISSTFIWYYFFSMLF